MIDTRAPVQEYLASLLRGDGQRCLAILDQQLSSGLPLTTLYADFIQASLYEIGDRWERNELSVSEEHLAASITEGLLNRVFASMVPASPVGRSVVVAAFAPEMHRIGARIVADVFELMGWNSHFVGGETPSGQLREALSTRTPDLVALSLTNPALARIFEKKLGELREARPKLEIIVGGQAMCGIGPSLAARDPLLEYLPTMEALERFLAEKIGASGPLLREPLSPRP